MEFQDRQLTCLDCHQPFTFTAGEQEFYEKKGFREEPKRCRPCREARKSKRQDGGIRQMSGGGQDDDNFGNRADDGAGWSGGGRSVGGRRAGGGNGGGGTREMFDATCAQCGAVARVPFRPSPGRPVYCKDCFGSRAGAP
jgi:CxxC-x17-CxxC domain-containing protein